jgi:hypothetical protein
MSEREREVLSLSDVKLDYVEQRIRELLCPALIGYIDSNGNGFYFLFTFLHYNDNLQNII